MRDEAFEELFSEHAQPLLAFLTYRTGDRVLAEDLVAETFERVLRARRRFDPRKGRAQSWIYAIALNLLRDHARRRAAEERAVEKVAVGGRSSDAPHERLGERDELMAAMTGLNDGEREVIALRFGADMTVPEIAKLLGLKVPAAEGRLYRALNKLRHALAS